MINVANIQQALNDAALNFGILPPLCNAGAPTNGVTGAGLASPGQLLIDTTNKKLYINTNTLASPTWTVVGSQS